MEDSIYIYKKPSGNTKMMSTSEQSNYESSPWLLIPVTTVISPPRDGNEL